jgi:dimethylglycine catabolism A
MEADILATPFRLGTLTLANRLVMGPMAANAPRADGGPSEQTIAFFEARAKGGVGLIIVGGMVGSARAAAESPVKAVLRPDLDDHIDDFRRMTNAVHRHGTAIIAEIMPSFGIMAVPAPDRPNISASARRLTIPADEFPRGFIVPGGRTTPMAEAATIEQIRQFEDDMIANAERALRSGFDGVELAAHMSYFAASFLSDRTNWRTDEYGGSVENRARFYANIVAGIRQRLPADFIVGLRITANDLMPDGQGATGFAQVARAIEKAGLDYVALSYGCYESMKASAPDSDGAMIDSGDARTFRDTLSVPLLIQGIHDPARAARAIAEGHGDLVMFARPMLADPEFARKVCQGRLDSIVRCIRDNTCMRRMVFGMPVRCDVNPAMGREGRHGRLPPLERIAKAPIEATVLGLTGSPAVMGLLGKLMSLKD